ncbi:hypothetical protein AB0M45_25720 [Nocardia sp. NPDC051787]|uniref:hypothetical protein n=1 Tax=Nocardia sp. NPDC051787 TaxID=3155415 RepID=UPI0034264743
MAQAIAVDRARWLGFRWRGQGLAGADRTDALDDFLLLGVQGGRGGGPEQSLIQRTAVIGSTPVAEAVEPDGPLVTVWSVRGAPHAHPLTRLDALPGHACAGWVVPCRRMPGPTGSCAPPCGVARPGRARCGAVRR